jgi:hypothetical protein
MLMVSSYAKDYVDACRAKVAAQLASYRKALAAKRLESDAFERQLFNHMILALDRYFVHRGRTIEGKDGNPLNEVRMLCDAIMENGGRMSANGTIRYKPETSILKFKVGDEIRLNADDFARLSGAFLDEIEKKYPQPSLPMNPCPVARPPPVLSSSRSGVPHIRPADRGVADAGTISSRSGAIGSTSALWLAAGWVSPSVRRAHSSERVDVA